MNRTFQRIALLCLCAWVSSPCRGQFLEGMRQAMANAETDIAFYGMVVDQYESPVVGAEVTLDLLQSSSLTESGMSISTVRVTTDDAGFFSIQDKRGIQLSIVKIERAGYEFTRTEISQETFVYRKNLAYARGEHGRDVPFVADRAKPIFFHMRKRGATAFLIEGRTWNPQRLSLFSRSSSCLANPFCAVCSSAR